MSATALKNTKWRFSNLNHKNLEFFGLVPASLTHTGLICVKTVGPNISSLGPFKGVNRLGNHCFLDSAALHNLIVTSHVSGFLVPLFLCLAYLANLNFLWQFFHFFHIFFIFFSFFYLFPFHFYICTSLRSSYCTSVSVIYLFYFTILYKYLSLSVHLFTYTYIPIFSFCIALFRSSCSIF